MQAMSKGWLLAVALACVGNTAGLWYVATREPPARPARVAPVARADDGQATVLSKALRQVVEEREAKRSSAVELGNEPAAATEPAQEPAAPSSPSASGKRERFDPFARLGEIAEEILTRETRDAAWAASVEQHFARSAEAEGANVRVQRMACGSTRCAAELFIANRQVATKLPGWFGDGVVAFEGKPEQDGFTYKAIFARPGHKLRGTL